MQYTPINIKENFIRLDAALKLSGKVSTGGHAQVVIQNGEVTVNGGICTMRGKKLFSGDRFEFENSGFEIE